MPDKIYYEKNKSRVKENALRWEKENPEKRREIVKRYKRTLKGMILERYKEMRCRVEGKRPRGKHRYEGLSICSKSDFLNWSMSNLKLISIYCTWVISNYQRKLSPSVDRINPARGYDLNNIQWITLSENSSKGGKARHGL